jgi:tetratricopeptide (TPR) repeat protein
MVPCADVSFGSAKSAPPSRGEWLVVGGIFLAALSLRLLNLQQIQAHDPFFALPSADPRFYDLWAREIAAGDWLGEGVFLQGPLYPYLLGLVYRLFGVSFLVPRLLQCLLGSITCVLVWALGRQLFDRRVGVVAAGLTCVYSMLIFYEGSLLIANVLPPINLLLLLAVLRGLEAPAPGRWGLAGALTALASLARPNMILYALFIALWLPWALGRGLSRGRRLALVGAFCAGFGLLVLPSAIRNYVVSGDRVLITAAAGMNFYNGNNPDANGVHRVPNPFRRAQADHPVEQNRVYEQYAERELGGALQASEVSSYWLERGLEYVRRHPLDWLGLELRKLGLFFNAFEVWNNRSYDVTRQFSWVLRLPLLGFGAMAPFALVGLWLTAGGWRRLTPVYALLGVHLLTALAFFVLSRYRMPIVPVLAVFAASAVVWFFDAVRAGRGSQLAKGALATALALAAVNLPIESVFGISNDLSVAYYNLGNKYRSLEKYELAIAQYQRSLDLNAGYISAHNNLALTYEKTGRHDAEAVATWLRVLEMGREQGLPRYVEIASRHLRTLGTGPGVPSHRSPAAGAEREDGG